VAEFAVRIIHEQRRLALHATGLAQALHSTSKEGSARPADELLVGFVPVQRQHASTLTAASPPC
jgi:hypothetical protein